MKKLLPVMLVSMVGLSACTTTPEQNTILGAVGGAAAGAAVSSGSDRTTGALTGALIGGVAGTMMGQTGNTGKCYYSDGRGGRYIANC